MAQIIDFAPMVGICASCEADGMTCSICILRDAQKEEWFEASWEEEVHLDAERIREAEDAAILGKWADYY